MYSGDTRFNDNIAPSLAGADAYLCDASVPTALHTPEMSHMSVSEGVLAAKNEGVKLYVTHLFMGQSPRAELKELYADGIVVSENVTYEV